MIQSMVKADALDAFLSRMKLRGSQITDENGARVLLETPALVVAQSFKIWDGPGGSRGKPYVKVGWNGEHVRHIMQKIPDALSKLKGQPVEAFGVSPYFWGTTLSAQAAPEIVVKRVVNGQALSSTLMDIQEGCTCVALVSPDRIYEKDGQQRVAWTCHEVWLSSPAEKERPKEDPTRAARWLQLLG